MRQKIPVVVPSVRTYSDNTPKRLEIIGSFSVFLVLSEVVQFLYYVLVTNFPFDPFLAG